MIKKITSICENQNILDNINNESTELVITLGNNLKTFRVDIFKESLSDFAKRIQTSKSTLYRMEKGDPSVSVGSWSKAFVVMQTAKSISSASMPDTLLLAAVLDEAERNKEFFKG